MRAAVKNAAKYFPTAIISGRSRDKVLETSLSKIFIFPIFHFSLILPIYFLQVCEFVGLTELYYAGSHGMDIMGPVRPISKDHTKCIRSIDKQVKVLEF